MNVKLSGSENQRGCSESRGYPGLVQHCGSHDHSSTPSLACTDVQSAHFNLWIVQSAIHAVPPILDFPPFTQTQHQTPLNVQHDPAPATGLLDGLRSSFKSKITAAKLGTPREITLYPFSRPRYTMFAVGPHQRVETWSIPLGSRRSRATCAGSWLASIIPMLAPPEGSLVTAFPP